MQRVQDLDSDLGGSRWLVGEAAISSQAGLIPLSLLPTTLLSPSNRKGRTVSTWPQLIDGSTRAAVRMTSATALLRANRRLAMIRLEKCIDFYSTDDFSYTMLEFRRECFCDDSLKSDTAPTDSIMVSCAMMCAGDNKQLCDNTGASRIYHKCGQTCRGA
ncbi:hypothetical protein CC78DRAFT_60637 [Lojkania enalia]|uniref:WSC domain-containing protein n=1 Tax=Lojkania enalia TaxID=147567 RepID=A0A9P4KF51_9PLEO|nr:hypothetical protein CC78DRAFT_60637 [Didymosphaeria enalia]